MGAAEIQEIIFYYPCSSYLSPRLIREQLSRVNIWDDGRREHELVIVHVPAIAPDAALRPSSDAQ